jgi:hypothetical protein
MVRKKQLTVAQVNRIVSGKSHKGQTRFSDKDWKRIMEVVHGKSNVIPIKTRKRKRKS